jgi:hypothetical protein
MIKISTMGYRGNAIAINLQVVIKRGIYPYDAETFRIYYVGYDQPGKGAEKKSTSGCVNAN